MSMENLIKNKVARARKLTTRTKRDRPCGHEGSRFSVEGAITRQVDLEDLARWGKRAEDRPLVPDRDARTRTEWARYVIRNVFNEFCL